MKKTDHPGRNKIRHWMQKNGGFLKRGKLDEHIEIYVYSVGGYPVVIIDFYSKKDNDEYQGFEIFTQAGGNSVSEAIDRLEQLRD